MFRSISILIFIFFASFLFGQSFEVGATFGISNYSGDFVPMLPFSAETNLAAGGFARLNFSKNLSVKTSFMTTTLSGSDSNYDNFQRNLSFRTPITEIAIIPEYNFTFFKENKFLKDWRPFLFAGVGMFKFNPQTMYRGSYVDLQPLGTEGQGMPGQPAKYGLTQIAIPFGGGVKMEINRSWNLEFFMNIRYTFTDYIDDVSTNYASNLDELINANGTLAGDLSSRQWEYLNQQCLCEDHTPANTYSPSTQRGGEDIGDYYFTVGVAVSYKIFKFSEKKNHKEKCPKWK